MKNIVKELTDLRELIVIDCTVGGQLLGIEQQQWLKRIDKIKLEAEALFNNVDLADVSVSAAEEYASFCVMCDREQLPLIRFNDWVKKECECIRIVGGGNKWNTANCVIHSH